MKRFWSMVAAGAILLSAEAYDNFGAAFKAGQKARSRKDYAAALICFTEAEKLAQNDSSRCDAFFYQGLVLAEDGQVDAGVARIREAVKISPNPRRSVTLQYHIGYYLQKNKRIDEGIEELKKARAMDPECPMADTSGLLAADLLVSRGKFAEAEKLLQSVAAAPAAPDGRIRALAGLLLLSYRMNGDASPIAAQLEAAGVQQGQTEVERCCRLWDYYLRTKQIDKALAQAKLLENNVMLTGSQRDQGTYCLARTYSLYTKEMAKSKECWEKIRNSKNADLARQAKEHLAGTAK